MHPSTFHLLLKISPFIGSDFGSSLNTLLLHLSSQLLPPFLLPYKCISILVLLSFVGFLSFFLHLFERENILGSPFTSGAMSCSIFPVIHLPYMQFVQWLLDENKRFLFLTNSSDKTREELQQKLARMGVDVETEHFYTAALVSIFIQYFWPPGT